MFSLIGLAAGGVGELLQTHADGITQVLGGVTILLGLLFFGAFDRFMFAGPDLQAVVHAAGGPGGSAGARRHVRHRLDALHRPDARRGDGAVRSQSGTAARGAFLCFIYGLGLGIPFLLVAAIFQRMVGVLGFFKRNARMVSRIGGALLVVVGLLEVTGAWTAAIVWLKEHWFELVHPVAVGARPPRSGRRSLAG